MEDITLLTLRFLVMNFSQLNHKKIKIKWQIHRLSLMMKQAFALAICIAEVEDYMKFMMSMENIPVYMNYHWKHH